MPRCARYLGPGHGPAPAYRFRSRLATGLSPVVTPPPAPLTPLGAAIASADQTIVADLVADWDRTGYTHPLAYLSTAMSELTIDRSATGTLPIEAGLVEGYASAQLTATLDGTFNDGVTQVADALAPYRTDSALYGMALLTAPVSCAIGANTEGQPSTVTQFTGQVRSLRVDSGTRSVELIAADPADTLRAPITLPAYGIYNPGAVGPFSNYFAVRPQAIIDFVLRRNGIYASPPPHPQAQISCTGHGWLAAEVGVGGTNIGTGNAVDGDAWWIPGPFGMLAVRGIFGADQTFPATFSAREQYSPTAGNGIGMSAWVYVGNDMGLPATDIRLFSLRPCLATSYQISMDFTGTGLLVGFIEGPTSSFGFSKAITTPAQWMYVGLHFQHNANGTTTISFRQNGVTVSGTNTTPPVTTAIIPFLNAAANLGCVSWSNFQVWYDPNPPVGDWPGEVHTSQATIDPGLNLMPIVPDVVNTDSWTVIQDVAGAEYGLVGFDEFGEFFFKSRDHATDPTSIEKTVTADTSLLSLSVTNSVDSVRNIIAVDTVATYLNNGIIFQASDVNEFDCQVGTTIFGVPLDYGVIVGDGGIAYKTLPQLTTAAWDSESQQFSGNVEGFVAVRADSPSTEVTSNVTVLFFTASDRLAWIIVYNTSGFPLQFATTTGNAALGVSGFTPGTGNAGITAIPPHVITVSEQVSDQGSVDVYGQRLLEIPASPYRQLLPPFETIANLLLAELATPATVLDQITINGDPELKLGDTMKLVDQLTNGTILASIVHITRKLSGGQLMDTLSVRPVTPP